MKKLFFLILIPLVYGNILAQDTIKITGKSFDSSAFANDDTLTRSDYLLGIGKVFLTLNKTPDVGQFATPIKAIIRDMDEDDSALDIIKERLSVTNRTVNIRNLQMFNLLLDHLSTDNKRYNKKLTYYDSILDATKKQIFLIRKDSLMQRIFRSRSLMETFKPQLIIVHDKWQNADSIIKQVNILIDQTLARISNNIITIEELSTRADALLETTGLEAFSKERRYIWEAGTTRSTPTSIRGFSSVLSDERKITLFYFEHSRDQLSLLLFTGIIFFYWIFYNFRSAKRLEKTDQLDAIDCKFVTPVPLLISLIFILDLAPLFDLNAPAIYIEAIGFVLMLALTALFWKQMSHTLFYTWIAFIALFIAFAATRFLGLSFYIQRWWTFSVNLASCVTGIYALVHFEKQLRKFRAIFWVLLLYILFNMIAVVCNIFGRVTLTQIFGATANTALFQAVGLTVFVQFATEAFLLQIQSSRIRKQYSQHFEYSGITKGISLLVAILAIFIWLVVFFTNLNLYDLLNDWLISFLTTPRELGSISFTFNGIILFLAIIWTANFLQRYIAYFFGDIGDDEAFNNKGPRSRLLITRLVLLIVGFLLAVAASGLPLDKITVILGALGIGIGLGLQNIVTNFVSGIILIFDRPLRIGDTVEIGDKKGRVKEIRVRSSTLLTPEGAEVIIPNGDILSHNIVNWTLSDNNIRTNVSFMIHELIIDDDKKQGIKELIRSLPGVVEEKSAEILITAVTEKSIEIKVFFWCKDVTKTEQMRSDVYAAVYKYLHDRDIKVIW
jgi:potassium efflux system protein